MLQNFWNQHLRILSKALKTEVDFCLPLVKFVPLEILKTSKEDFQDIEGALEFNAP